jgi:2,4-dienoyl-CoA reductase (NADPH2)
MRLPVEVVRRERAAAGPDCIVIDRISLIGLIPEGSTRDAVVTRATAIEGRAADIAPCIAGNRACSLTPSLAGSQAAS